MNDFNLNIERLDWNKMQDLIPAIIQHADTGEVLMLGYMNQEALSVSIHTRRLTLYSRSKNRLWHKGDTSGNTMMIQKISSDCDHDSVLVQVIPSGPACHLGYSSCFQPAIHTPQAFLDRLIRIIAHCASSQKQKSYTEKLCASGINRCAQKVGEEAVEVVIAAVGHQREEFIQEAADLLFHLLVLLQVSQLNFYDVLRCLQGRHQLKEERNDT